MRQQIFTPRNFAASTCLFVHSAQKTAAQMRAKKVGKVSILPPRRGWDLTPVVKPAK